MVLTPARRVQWASRVSAKHLRGGVEKNGVVLRQQYEQVFRAGPSSPLPQISWGCNGFDAVIDRFGLRVRELFSLINEQIKIDANNVVSMADYRAQRLAA